MSEISTKIFYKNIENYQVGILNILLLDSGLVKKQIISAPSQIGCNNKCNFCISKDSSLIRNLTAKEILELISLVPKESNDIEISFTGEGEPIHNIKNINLVLNELEKDPSISSIKLAFSGLGSILLNKIKTSIPVTLQFSLHHADEIKRKLIIPFSDSLETIKLNLKKYERLFSKININYVLMDGINDSKDDLELLDKFTEETNWNILFNPLMTDDILIISDKYIESHHKQIKVYKKIGQSIVENKIYSKLTYKKVN